MDPTFRDDVQITFRHPKLDMDMVGRRADGTQTHDKDELCAYIEVNQIGTKSEAVQTEDPAIFLISGGILRLGDAIKAVHNEHEWENALGLSLGSVLELMERRPLDLLTGPPPSEVSSLWMHPPQALQACRRALEQEQSNHKATRQLYHSSRVTRRSMSGGGGRFKRRKSTRKGTKRRKRKTRRRKTRRRRIKQR